ncbi:oxygen-dependent coproporphyrinogen-III oxidase [Polymorphobacter multimanifer]|uniref:coproporphyrinogen oxidase n=1 Tax=Polymorphobacter multimanifer TaxID=1070431 RepID=A0A841L9Y6_9SPHN|nr:oxygen-dependent coproporphyrinogen oxidase [Polymorphobacter multimanifer]MBB6226655.1 coproporphyrinogen III oxidase [Polymorphobacter multimanifer]GGI69226.1 oxygen-dependent coproporphyrinogen-III oxidase [Polymorphobacter multimanifer]
MYTLDDRQTAAQTWFREARDRICAALESVEDDGRGEGPAGRFERVAWNRNPASNEDTSGFGGDGEGGGGVMSVMKGRVFEKAGVNISTVHGVFAPEFAKQINGAAEDPRFFATGISLVIHPRNPLVPAVHLNTRYLVTTKRWFGGGMDLNPAIADDAQTSDFHAALKVMCDRHDASYYPAHSKWAEEYFWVPHRGRHRGVGGIFYDHLDSGDWERDFAYTQDVGRTFAELYPRLVREKMALPFTEEQRAEQLRYRGLYAEFNLVHDRGTVFGLKTGGNIEAILMSLPPLARWD